MKKLFIPLLLICRQSNAQDCEPVDSVIATIVSTSMSELEYQSQLVQQFKVKN